jgi:uridine kinase
MTSSLAKTRVFLSHSSADSAFAERIMADLSARRWSWFYDKHSISAGDLIPDKIDEALGEMEFFVCLLSKASLDSLWVKHELSAALMKSLSSGTRPVVVPLVLEPLTLPAILSPLKCIDFTKEEVYQAALEELADRLGLTGVGDDDRYRDESLFTMPGERRRDQLLRILSDRHALPDVNDQDRYDSILDTYRGRNFDVDGRGRVFLNARILAHWVANRIAKLPGFSVSNTSEPFVISVCGFPGLGKTTFARELHLSLSADVRASCSIVEFEKWMKNRSLRWDGSRNVISGFDSSAFHFDELAAAVHRLLGGHAISAPTRSNGERNTTTAQIQPAAVIILDGVLAFLDEFNRHSDYNVYFEADLATRYLLSALKDSYVRGYEASRWDSKFRIHEATYPQFIQLLRRRANLIAMASPYHRYQCYSIREPID